MNYLKKLGQHKIKDYIDLKMVIRPLNLELPLIEKFHIYEGYITPNRMIENKNVYDIEYIDPLFIINGFTVITENDLVKNIILIGHHPNRDPDTYLYCLPDLKKDIPFDEYYYSMLLVNIRTYYLDQCYFKPTNKQIKYKKLKSMYIKINP